ncbi:MULTISPECIES: PucR family transcriptional regulator [Pseudonocardia]|uniref:Carbohydrate diacid transcriptional activator CdaR n=2 Tax=Pseudonocardia TaxID=1847 RepID=A0A1Y2MKB8_PSEAH|nr:MULTISPECIES: helix-turn-helix domain-containing protein [Pseudonocardia]OSY35602.1 carbohydrate diacid transcriptional activator CdaR [Pseudonocardia autotrophica]TDN76893.1 CdaR family transcriptional regulator [Pseudonocardia autotrophica]BBG00896.1 transcriptional regulator [Pseudonocardia autotrophica]GEC27545.1 transcriptional regulator [Pseudonocardia saturnea]
MTTSQQDPAGDFESIGRYVTRTICDENVDYSVLDTSVLADVVETNVHNARIYTHAILDRRKPTSDDLAALAAAARRRVHQGVTLEAMLRAYRIGARAMWADLSTRRPDIDQSVLTDWTLRYIDWVSSEAERAYLRERDQLVDSRHETIRLLISRLIEDDFPSPRDRDDAARTLGLDSSAPHVAVLIGPTGGSGGSVDELLQAVQQEIRRAVPGAVAVLLRRGTVVVVPGTGTTGIEQAVRRCVTRVTDRAGIISAGVGRPATSLAGLGTAVHEAERAKALGEILQPDGWVHRYEEMSFFDLFRHGDPVDSFVETVLGDHLDGAESTGRIDVIRTLYVYFTVGMNRRVAASRLGIHPNTLDYRLRQASKTAGVDLTSSENSFRYQLAVRLLPICSSSSRLYDRIGPAGTRLTDDRTRTAERT